MAVPGSIVATGKLITPGGDQGLTGQVGPVGPIGQTGATGQTGAAAHTLSTASFTVPATGGTVTVTVQDSSWMVVGEILWIDGANGPGLAGPMRIQSIAGNAVTLINLASSSPVPGDMTRAVYDIHSMGIVDAAQSIPWTGVTGKRIADFYGADTTNNGAYAITVSSDFALAIGVTVYFTISIANAANGPTLNVNGLGAKPIVNKANIALFANELQPLRTVGAVYDGTSFRVFTFLTRIYNTNNPANPTIECAGYDAIFAYCGFSSATGAGITLAHVAFGAVVWVDVVNTTGAALPYFVNMTSPTGAAYGGTWIFVTTGQTTTATYKIDSGATPSLTNGNHMLLTGIAGIGYFK